MEFSGAVLTIVKDYNASDIDEASDPKYYGFLAVGGRWYIMKMNTAAGTCRYVVGTENYSDAWAARATLDYYYFDQVFRQ